MDPSQSECYATAQVQLRELFLELSRRGGVGADELQRELLPFTAGDVRRDLLALVDDLQRRRSILDEHEFVRVMWRKMYLPHLLFAATLTAGDHSGGETTVSSAVNVPFTHVLVSLKRRAQMQQFANYYKTRGISGADHLTPSSSSNGGEATERRTKRASPRLAPPDTTTNSKAPVTMQQLRQRRFAAYDVVACVFDGSDRAMKTHVIRQSVRYVHMEPCSPLYCSLYCHEAGVLALGSSYFAEQAQQEFHAALDRYNASETGGRCPVRPIEVAVPVQKDTPSILLAKLDDLGLRNVVAASSATGRFVVSTGRKLHLWKSPEPLQVFTAQAEADSRAVDSIDCLEPIGSSTEEVELVDMNADGDCLGLLGGSKLLGRTKTIVDLAQVTHLAANNVLLLAQTSTGELFAYHRSVSISTGSAAPPASLSADQVKPSMIKIPLEIASPTERVRRIACGRNHAVVMTSAGSVFVWGSNECGQLGLGDDCPVLDRHVKSPTRLKLRVCTDGSDSDAVHEALDVACGNDHTLVLMADGRVLACGCHWYGQLGLGETEEQTEGGDLVDGCCYLPTRVPVQQNGDQDAVTTDGQVYLITAQGDSSAAVTARGDVFQWGQCVPSGRASVCGLVSRWRPELVEELTDSSGFLHSTTSPQGPSTSWHSIAIARGVLVLSRHVESTSQDQ